MLNETPVRQPAAELVLDDEERAIVALFANGLVLDAIARRLCLSERTVRRRIRAMCDRVGVDTPVQVIVLAARQGVV
ncbi:MAG TPA: LuxR C-terminal-related transcriptional regulator [Pseudonocardiaceae bacterium]|jgi:DNA-binding NarL/FixJ family response regulator|nr:LuxR C-terminal-related transcriptional regulator [Pseudonocardiaceae bacterium]